MANSLDFIFTRNVSSSYFWLLFVNYQPLKGLAFVAGLEVYHRAVAYLFIKAYEL